jgi:hypothetical protein
MSFNPDKFYELPEAERIALIGERFEDHRGHLFFIVGLNEDEYSNYGRKQGIIFVTQIYDTNDGRKNWFRIGVQSPDDLDMDLDVCNLPLEETVKLRDLSIEILFSLSKVPNHFYIGILRYIQASIGCGTFTS